MQDNSSKVGVNDSDDEDFQKRIRESLEYWYKALKIGMLVAPLLYLMAHIVYFVNFNKGFSDSNTDWGTFGDFIGGSLNPLFSLLAFLALIYTIKLQSVELRNSATQLKKSAEALRLQNSHWERQNFESTFFNLIENFRGQREFVNFTLIRNGVTNKCNYQSIPIHINEFIQTVYDVAKQIPQNKIDDINDCSSFNEHFGKLINEFLAREGNYLMKYCDGLGFIASFIDRSTLEAEDKKFYFNLLNTQINASEQAFLFLFVAVWRPNLFESFKVNEFFLSVRFTFDESCPLTRIKDNICKV